MGSSTHVCEECSSSFDTSRGLNVHKTKGHEQGPSKDELIAELRRLAGIVERTPAQSDMTEYGEFAFSTYVRKFGSWNSAVTEAGFAPNRRDFDNDEELLKDIRSAAKQVKGHLTRREYNEIGQFSSDSVRRTFGSWSNAKQEAGLDWPPSEDELLAAIKSLAQDAGDPPTAGQMRQDGKYSAAVYQRRFGTWNTALEEAGFETRIPGSAPGSLNGNWQEESTHKYGSNWPEQREEALKRDRYQCQAPGCGVTREEHLTTYGKDIEVHHIRPRREFVDDSGDLDEVNANRLENLVTLCHHHHRQWEGIPLRPQPASDD